jgi:hypothetical protein
MRRIQRRRPKHRNLIGLLYLLDKNEQDDLTESQRRILRALAPQ